MQNEIKAGRWGKKEDTSRKLLADFYNKVKASAQLPQSEYDRTLAEHRAAMAGPKAPSPFHYDRRRLSTYPKKTTRKKLTKSAGNIYMTDTAQ
jgi:hypothetical protein